MRFIFQKYSLNIIPSQSPNGKRNIAVPLKGTIIRKNLQRKLINQIAANLYSLKSSQNVPSLIKLQ